MYSMGCTEQGSVADSTCSGVFVFAVLRKAGVPDHLIKLWMGPLASPTATRHNCTKTSRIVENGARRLAGDSSRANWVTKAFSQFARHSLRKPILRQVLKNGCGVRFELTTFGL